MTATATKRKVRGHICWKPLVDGSEVGSVLHVTEGEAVRHAERVIARRIRT